MKKITNVSALEAVISLVLDAPHNVMPEFSNEELVEKLQTMQATFAKKNSTARKPSAQQVENDRLRAQIMELMADGILRNTSDIRDGLGLPNETTPQRISGLLKPLVADGQLVSQEIKRKKFYSIPGDAATEE